MATRIFCPECGEENTSEAILCAKCGANLKTLSNSNTLVKKKLGKRPARIIAIIESSLIILCYVIINSFWGQGDDKFVIEMNIYASYGTLAFIIIFTLTLYFIFFTKDEEQNLGVESDSNRKVKKKVGKRPPVISAIYGSSLVIIQLIICCSFINFDPWVALGISFSLIFTIPIFVIIVPLLTLLRVNLKRKRQNKTQNNPNT